MSDDDTFLARWSRRKREVAESERVAAEAPSAKPEPQAAPSEEPEFDISKLPSLDSITASTDMTAFMQPGVPAALRHAALRRAWSADPAIRDFIGLSENAWDFTKPNEIAGFGEIAPGTDVARMARRILGEAVESPEEPAETPAVRAEAEQIASPSPAELPEAEPSEELLHRTDDSASQQIEPDQPAIVRLARKHGGAMPQ
jgi:hypothetical protein